MDLLLILNGTSRCLSNPRLPESLHHTAGTSWWGPGGGGHVYCVLTLWFTDTAACGWGLFSPLSLSPLHSHRIRFSAFAISSSALSCQHLERVLVSVKLSAPPSIGKVSSNIRYLWRIQHFQSVCQSSRDATSLMNNIVWLTSSLFCSGGNHLSWHRQPKPHPQPWQVLLNIKLIFRKPAVCYSQLVQSMHFTRWIKGQEEQICHELALSCPGQIPWGFCWDTETSLWIFEIFWFSW